MNKSFSENTWVHIVVIWDTANSVGKVYQNGLQIASGAISDATWTPNNETVQVGSPVFPGIIDDLRIYNRALSATEIYALYSAGR